MRTFFARFSVFLFHPFFSVIYLYALIFLGRERMSLTSLTHAGKTQMLLLILLTTCILPLMLLLTCRFSGVVKNLRLVQKEERYIPAVLVMLTYGTVAWFFESRLHLPPWLSKPMFVVFGVSVLVLLINIFHKVSVYVLSLTVLTGLLAGLCFGAKDQMVLLLLIFSIILSGGMMSMRIYGNRHTPRQVYTGAMIGIPIGLYMAYLVF